MVQTGDTLDYYSASPIAAGTIVVIGRLIGVIIRQLLQADIDAGRKASAVVEGVFTFPKATGVTITQGQALFWGSSNLSNVATGRQFAGYATTDQGSSDTTVNVKLSAIES
jgi:predicted RecA/RadA family phage recombinase